MIRLHEKTKGEKKRSRVVTWVDGHVAVWILFGSPARYPVIRHVLHFTRQTSKKQIEKNFNPIQMQTYFFPKMFLNCSFFKASKQPLCLLL